MADPISFMVAAYIVTVAALLAYGVALLRRLARAERKLDSLNVPEGAPSKAEGAARAARPGPRPGVAGASLTEPGWREEEVPHA